MARGQGGMRKQVSRDRGKGEKKSIPTACCIFSLVCLFSFFLFLYQYSCADWFASLFSSYLFFSTVGNDCRRPFVLFSEFLLRAGQPCSELSTGIPIPSLTMGVRKLATRWQVRRCTKNGRKVCSLKFARLPPPLPPPPPCCPSLLLRMLGPFGREAPPSWERRKEREESEPNQIFGSSPSTFPPSRRLSVPISVINFLVCLLMPQGGRREREASGWLEDVSVTLHSLLAR